MIGRLGGSKGRSRRFGKEKIILLLPDIEPGFLGFLGRSLVTIPTTLPRLQYGDYDERKENGKERGD